MREATIEKHVRRLTTFAMDHIRVGASTPWTIEAILRRAFEICGEQRSRQRSGTKNKRVAEVKSP